MKKMLLVLVLAVMSTALFAQKSYGDFVATLDGVFFFKNVRHGLSSYLVGKKANGEKQTFTKFEVLEFQNNGIRYEKMPVYKNRKLSSDFAFMKVINYRNGMKLYKYDLYSVGGIEFADYFIFKRDKLVVDVNAKNVASINQFYSRKK